jgi:hypothetical protein
MKQKNRFKECLKKRGASFLVMLRRKLETSNPFASKDTSANASNETKKRNHVKFYKVTMQSIHFY